MSHFTSSMSRGCMIVVIVLLLLTGFCLANVEPGTGPYYLCLFSLILDVPFFLFLLGKLMQSSKKERHPEDHCVAENKGFASVGGIPYKQEDSKEET